MCTETLLTLCIYVLVVVVHISHINCWITYYCTRIEVSVLRGGRGRVGGGEGGWKILVTEPVVQNVNAMCFWCGD